MRRAVYAGLIFMVLSGCSSLEPESPKAFFNMDSLVNAQVTYLSTHSPVLQKTGVVQDEHSEEADLRPDSVQWDRELAIFRRADINKPRLRELYTEETKTLASGVVEHSYRPRKSGNLTVRELVIRYSNEQLNGIKAIITDNNPLYTSERILTMEFEERDGADALTAYAITGGQQMKLKDSVTFRLEARILYD